MLPGEPGKMADARRPQTKQRSYALDRRGTKSSTAGEPQPADRIRAASRGAAALIRPAREPASLAAMSSRTVTGV